MQCLSCPIICTTPVLWFPPHISWHFNSWSLIDGGSGSTGRKLLVISDVLLQHSAFPSFRQTWFSPELGVAYDFPDGMTWKGSKEQIHVRTSTKKNHFTLAFKIYGKKQSQKGWPLTWSLTSRSMTAVSLFFLYAALDCSLCSNSSSTKFWSDTSGEIHTFYHFWTCAD